MPSMTLAVKASKNHLPLTTKCCLEAADNNSWQSKQSERHKLRYNVNKDNDREKDSSKSYSNNSNEICCKTSLVVFMFSPALLLYANTVNNLLIIAMSIQQRRLVVIYH
uniref:Uncharacterized protein n=1 Tax=Glossina pallidipes TaxID=7398 RepID=A0A1B0AGS1_GLOPL